MSKSEAFVRSGVPQLVHFPRLDHVYDLSDPVNRTTVVLADADADKAPNNNPLEERRMHPLLEFDAGQTDSVQFLLRLHKNRFLRLSLGVFILNKNLLIENVSLEDQDTSRLFTSESLPLLLELL